MNYKFQDILKIGIPGLYLAFAISVVIYMTDSDGQYVLTELLNMLKTPFANAIAVFLPFGGYIIGYLLNVIASGLERLAYEKEWLKRPSLHVLQKWDKEYYVKDSECIFKTLGFTNTFSSENTRLAFRKAIKRIAKHFGLDDNFLSADKESKRGVVSLYVLNHDQLYVGFGYDCNFYLGQRRAIDLSRRVKPNMIKAE